MSERWRIDQLTKLTGQALEAASYDGQPSGRVRDVPDARTIRYYTTIGILDRPLEMRGRVAFYGRRHLLQLVAIKRLQARGLPLVEIQRSLAAADDKALARWAALPSGFLEKAVAEEPQRTTCSPDELLRRGTDDIEPKPSRRQFWAAEPAVAGVGQIADAASHIQPRAAVVLPLGSGVSLLIEGDNVRLLNGDVWTEIEPAIRGLVAALEKAGITGERPGGRNSGHATTNQGD